MTRPSAGSDVPPAVAEQVTAGVQRTGMLRDRAASLNAQLTSPDTTLGEVDRAEHERLRAACTVAAAFYRAQLDGPDGAGPGRYLTGRGVPVGGRWVLGYAPDRPAGLVIELRRQGFTDTEILAAGLAATSRTGQLVDRFRNRVMVGVRDHRAPGEPVVAFVGQAPPGAAADVPPLLHTPATAIYRPGDTLFGLAEQADEYPSDSPPVIAGDALAAIAAAETQGVAAVAPCTPTLTARQAAALTATFDTADGVVVAVPGGTDSRRAAERAYAVLTPAYTGHPTRPGPVLAARPHTLRSTRPLLEVVVTAHVDWAARLVSLAGRQNAARTVRALLADADPATARRLGAYAASQLGLSTAMATPPANTPDAVPAPTPQTLAGAATPHGPPETAAPGPAEHLPKAPAQTPDPPPEVPGGQTSTEPAAPDGERLAGPAPTSTADHDRRQEAPTPPPEPVDPADLPAAPPVAASAAGSTPPEAPAAPDPAAAAPAEPDAAEPSSSAYVADLERDQLLLDFGAIFPAAESAAPAPAPPERRGGSADAAAAVPAAEDTSGRGGAAAAVTVVAEQRLAHPNPHGCLHCTNRATLRLTLTTGDQVTVCRPHAADYRRAAPPTTIAEPQAAIDLDTAASGGTSSEVEGTPPGQAGRGDESNLFAGHPEFAAMARPRTIPLAAAEWGMFGEITNAVGPDGSRTRLERGYVTEPPRIFTGGRGADRKYQGEPLLSFTLEMPRGPDDLGKHVGLCARPDAVFTLLDPPPDRPLTKEMSLSRRLPAADLRRGDVFYLWDEPGHQPGANDQRRYHVQADPEPAGDGLVDLAVLVDGAGPVVTQQLHGMLYVDIEDPRRRPWQAAAADEPGHGPKVDAGQATPGTEPPETTATATEATAAVQDPSATTGGAARLDPYPGLPAPPPPVATTGALAEFAPVEQARIRAQVEDLAGHYAASPLIGRSLASIGRYIGEGGALDDMAPGERWKRVAEAARQILADQPDLMDLDTPAKRAAYAADRTARTERILAAADAAYRAGDYRRAVDLLDRGQLIDPNHRPFGGSWSEMREIAQTRLGREPRSDDAAAGHSGDPEVDDTPTAPDIDPSTPGENAAPGPSEHDATPGTAGASPTSDRPIRPEGQPVPAAAATGITAAVDPHPLGWTVLDYQLDAAARALCSADDDTELAWAAGALLIDSFELAEVLRDPQQVRQFERTRPLAWSDEPQRTVHLSPHSDTISLLSAADGPGGSTAGEQLLLAVPISTLCTLLERVPADLAGRMRQADAAFRALEDEMSRRSASGQLADRAGLAAWHRWRPSYELRRVQMAREVEAAAAALWRTMRPGVVGREYENRLLREAVAAVPADVIGHDEQGRPTVLLDYAGRDVHGQVDGVDPDGQTVTATGFLVDVYPARSVGPDEPAGQLVVRLADQPGQETGPTMLRVASDARITVLPRLGQQDIDTEAPVLRMPEIEQILAARDVLGWTMEVSEKVVGDHRFAEWQTAVPVYGPMLFTLRRGSLESGRIAVRADFARDWIDQALLMGTYRPIGVLDAAGNPTLPAASDADWATGRAQTYEPEADEATASDSPDLQDGLFSLDSAIDEPGARQMPMAELQTRVDAARMIREGGPRAHYGQVSGAPCQWDHAPNGTVAVPDRTTRQPVRGYVVRVSRWTGQVRYGNATSRTSYTTAPAFWLTFVAPLPDVNEWAADVRMVAVPMDASFTALPEPDTAVDGTPPSQQWRLDRLQAQAHEMLATRGPDSILVWAAAAALLPQPAQIAAVLDGADPLAAPELATGPVPGDSGRHLHVDGTAVRLHEETGQLIREVTGAQIRDLLQETAASRFGLPEQLRLVADKQRTATAAAESAGLTARAVQLRQRAADSAAAQAADAFWDTARELIVAAAVARRRPLADLHRGDVFYSAHTAPNPPRYHLQSDPAPAGDGLVDVIVLVDGAGPVVTRQLRGALPVDIGDPLYHPWQAADVQETAPGQVVSADPVTPGIEQAEPAATSTTEASAAQDTPASAGDLAAPVDPDPGLRAPAVLTTGVPTEVPPVDQARSRDPVEDPAAATAEPDPTPAAAQDAAPPDATAAPAAPAVVLPSDAEPVKGVPGYHWYWDDSTDTTVITVYGPDNAVVATSDSTRGGFTGTVDGVRLPRGSWNDSFAIMAAGLHRAVRLPPGQQDRVRVRIVADADARAGYIVEVRGTIKNNDLDQRAAKTAAHFLFSGKKGAHVSGRQWTPAKVEENFGRLLLELARQGRAVVVEDTRTATATPPGGPAAQAAAPRPAPPAPSTPPEPEPASFSDEDLLAAVTRESARVGHGHYRNEAAAVRHELLNREQQQRVLRRIAEAPEVTGMTGPELDAERRWLTGSFASRAFEYHSEGDRTVRARRSAVEVEEHARAAREMLAGPPPAELDDAALRAAFKQATTLWVKLPHKHELVADMSGHKEALLDERAARLTRQYTQRPDVDGMSLDDLVAESVALTAELSAANKVDADDRELQRHDGVKQARKQRRAAVDQTADAREASTYAAELARATIRDNDYRRNVCVDDLEDQYGEVDPAPSIRGFYAKVSYLYAEDSNKTSLGSFPSRPAATAALVRHFDENPKTLPHRNWGPRRQVPLPVAARDELRDWIRTADRSPEQNRIGDILLAIPTRERHRNPLTGKQMQAYPYLFEQGLLGELSRIADRATAVLRERSENPQVPRPDRDAAKRRIPAIGAALHSINTLRDRLAAAGVDVDRRAVDVGQVAAQLAALAGSVDIDSSHGDGERRDLEQVQPDGPPPLGAVQAAGTGQDGRPGGVLHSEGQGTAPRSDRGARGLGGDAARGDGLRGAGGSAQPDPGDGRAGRDGAAAAAAGGRPGSGPADQPGRGGAGRDPAGAAGAVARFRPDPADNRQGSLARAAANLAAVETLRQLEEAGRAATPDEQRVLARWSGWGDIPAIFQERPDDKNPIYGEGGDREGQHGRDLARWERYSPGRDRLRELLDPFEWAAASRATLSAYYTPPALAEAMWAGLRAFGFAGGEVLEAGCGSGAFFGAAPDLDTVRLTGVELDPTTARICQYVYPHANVLAESFADTDAPAGAFDVAIGNVPFAHHVPFPDLRYGSGRHSLHAGFLIKQLALVREGGLVLAITSRWTLDAENNAARRQLAHYGDLLAAYRLPAGMFAEHADTDVVVDVLLLRRRPADENPADRTWLDAPTRTVNGTDYTVNAFYTAHPECILGQLTTHPGRFGPELTVTGDPGEAVRSLAVALSSKAQQAAAAGLGYLPHPAGVDRTPLHLLTAREKHATDFTGRLYRDEDGRIWQHLNGEDPVEAICADDDSQLLALMELRDVAVELKALDRIGEEAERAEQLRGRLRDLHAAYTQRYGPLSRPRQTRLAAPVQVRQQARAEGREVREDERVPTAWGWFRDDPDAATVLALEHWDRQLDQPVLSEVLTRRPGTLGARLERTDDPKVALAAVMGDTGCVDLDRIAQLLDTTADEARRRLSTDVFDDPVTGQLVHAGAYLSGAVRRKLDEARAAAATNPAYAVNVAALEWVQPQSKALGQFTPQLGAHWIPAPLVQGFLRDYLADPTLRVDHNDRYGWALYAGKVPDAINTLKGTGRRTALQIARAALGRGSLIVSDQVMNRDKLTHAVNEDASRAVRHKADAMRAAFEDYLTADSGRVTALTDAYNRVMNGHVVRHYDGLAPTLAGFTDQRTPHPWQLSGAARMQYERGVILAHDVGLGKTTTMIMGTQALKLSGQIRKPFVVAQKHLTGQWLDEARFLYPNADVRVITSEMLADSGRRRILEWLRSNTPDLTIFTEGAFLSIKMSPEFQEWYEFQELGNLKQQILRERGVPDNALAVIKLEQRLATLEARLRRNAAPMRTPGELYFEDLGFDYAAIDEAHRFLGVGFRSKEAGGTEARLRGVDLHQKLTHMHRLAEQHGGRPTATAGTGTPLVNSIAEQYTMLALFSPWVLDAYGVAGMDLWADTFGQKVQRIEMAPDGSGLKVVERFSRFISKAAMKTMWGLTADTKTAEEVSIPRPRIASGGPQLRLVEANTDTQTRLKKLIPRGAAVHAGEVTREEDSMLAVAFDGEQIACDSRLVDADAPPGTKLPAVADYLAQRYHAHKDRRYAVSHSDPTPHPVRGALHIGWLNKGTPGGNNRGGFDAYAALRDLCVERGVPREKIAFIQEHNSSVEKLHDMYRQAREGRVAIVLASTTTMGTGANVQNRAITSAHIDLDWNPAGIAQRDGRAHRYGNQNDEVEIVIFATKGSMDSWKAGLLASKAEGLRDIQRPTLGDDDDDSVDEIDDTEWDYATMQAEIGSNPYMALLLTARRHLNTLESDRRNQAVDRLRQTELLEQKTTEAKLTRAAIARRSEVLPLITPVRGEDFTIAINKITYQDRRPAGAALRRAIIGALGQHRSPGRGGWQLLGQFGGLPFGVQPNMTPDGQLSAYVGFPDLRTSAPESHTYAVADLTSDRVGTTMLGRLAGALEKAPDEQTVDIARLPDLDHEVALLAGQQAAVDYSARIEHARTRVNLIDNVVAAIVDLDHLPELTPETVDRDKYPTVEAQQQAITERATERQPLQDVVDRAVAALETFDRNNPAPTTPPPTAGAPPDSVAIASRPALAAAGAPSADEPPPAAGTDTEPPSGTDDQVGGPAGPRPSASDLLSETSPARKGDLILVEYRSRPHYTARVLVEAKARGRTLPDVQTEYVFGMVASTTRDGEVRTWRETGFGDQLLMTAAQQIGRDRHWVLSAKMIDVAAALTAAKAHHWPGHPGQPQSFETFEQAHQAVLPLLVAAAPDATAGLDQATVVPILLADPGEIDWHDCNTAEPSAEVVRHVTGTVFAPHPDERDPAQYADAARDIVAKWQDLAEGGMGLGMPWVQVLMSEQHSGHKLHIAAADLQQVRDALHRVWPVCQQAGLGLKAVGSTENLAHNHGKGLTIYLPRRATIHRDTTLVAAALRGYDPSVADIYGDTQVIGAVWHRYEFTQDPGHDVDTREYYRLYQPAARPTAAPAGRPAVTPLTPAEIVEATTSTERELLDAFTAQALRAEPVHAAAQRGDHAAFVAAFPTAMENALIADDRPGADDIFRLYNGSEALRAGLTGLVWTGLAPALRSTAAPATAPASALAAAAAAQAFLPTPRRAGPASLPAPAVPAPARAGARRNQSAADQAGADR